MTDKEIIKALECCESHTCFGCPFYADMGYKCKGVNAQLIDLINRQQAEIDRLNSCVMSEEQVRAIMKSQMYIVFKEVINQTVDTAIKEFAEKLIAKRYFGGNATGYGAWQVEVKDIYNLVKEMVGADNGK